MNLADVTVRLNWKTKNFFASRHEDEKVWLNGITPAARMWARDRMPNINNLMYEIPGRDSDVKRWIQIAEVELAEWLKKADAKTLEHIAMLERYIANSLQSPEDS